MPESRHGTRLETDGRSQLPIPEWDGSASSLTTAPTGDRSAGRGSAIGQERHGAGGYE